MVLSQTITPSLPGLAVCVAQFHERHALCHGALDLALGVMGRVVFPVPGGSERSGHGVCSLQRRLCPEK